MALRYRSELDTFDRPPLEPRHRPGWIRLDKNEAPFSPREETLGLLGALQASDVRVYPDPYPVYQKLSAFTGLPADQHLLTFGSEQALRYAFEMMVRPGDEVVYLRPTFAMIDVFARQFGATPVVVPFGDDRSLHPRDIIGRVNKKTRLVVLANPNNPTGTVLQLDDLRSLCERTADVGALLALDEAYYHYCTITGQELISDFPNLAITRTFSKAWGLAGIRVGYITAQETTIELFRRLKPIDEASTLSLAVCSAALDHPEVLEQNVNHVAKWKARFEAVCGEHVTVLPSEGNYVLVRLNAPVDSKVRAWFQEQRIACRYHADTPGMRAVLRFCIGSGAVMKTILAALRRIDHSSNSG